MSQWVLSKERANIELMSKTLGINAFLCQLLVNRGIRTKHTAIKFLNPQNKFLHDSNGLFGMQCAIKKLETYKNKKVVIYGDYDVDGVMSCVILYKGLSSFFNDISYYIPNREMEGYGLNKNAITTLHKNGVTLILACDNGISAIEEVDYANSLGIEVIIIDHHEPIIKNNSEILPNAIIINPKQSNCTYPFKELCAATLCYKFIVQLYMEWTENSDLTHNNIFNELLAFAAIATLCDIVDLMDENRIIVNTGLKQLNESVSNIGLLQLIRENNIHDITEETIGFKIGPCINAAGRLSEATLAVSLFIENDKEKVKSKAKEIIEINEKRKFLTNDAIKNVEDNLQSSDNVIVIYNKEIHESIAGIVAGRIKEKLYKPCVIITKGHDLAKGSGRSVEGYNLYKELSNFRHLFAKFGGHEMAAGLSIKEENINELRKGLNINFNHNLSEVVHIDTEFNLDEVTYTLATGLNVLRPFGKRNPPPLFVTYNVPLDELRIINDKNTIIFTFLTKTGRHIKGINFGEVDRFSQMIHEKYTSYEANKIMHGILRGANIFLDIVYYIDINNYNGITSVQLKIRDYKIRR